MNKCLKKIKSEKGTDTTTGRTQPFGDRQRREPRFSNGLSRLASLPLGVFALNSGGIQVNRA
jgi:hypothetical protein